MILRALAVYIILALICSLHPIALVLFLIFSVAVVFIGLLILFAAVLFVFIKHGFCKDFWLKVRSL